MLKLGYKASAEQFAPAKLLDFGVHGGAGGVRLRASSATISSPGSTPTAMRPLAGLARRARRADRSGW